MFHYLQRVNIGITKFIFLFYTFSLKIITRQYFVYQPEPKCLIGTYFISFEQDLKSLG